MNSVLIQFRSIILKQIYVLVTFKMYLNFTHLLKGQRNIVQQNLNASSIAGNFSKELFEREKILIVFTRFKCVTRSSLKLERIISLWDNESGFGGDALEEPAF